MTLYMHGCLQNIASWKHIHVKLTAIKRSCRRFCLFVYADVCDDQVSQLIAAVFVGRPISASKHINQYSVTKHKKYRRHSSYSMQSQRTF